MLACCLAFLKKRIFQVNREIIDTANVINYPHIFNSKQYLTIKFAFYVIAKRFTQADVPVILYLVTRLVTVLRYLEVQLNVSPRASPDTLK